MEERLDAWLRDLPPAGVHALVRKIAEIDEFKGWWAGRKRPGPSLLGRRKKRIVVISAGASTGIERRKLSPAEVPYASLERIVPDRWTESILALYRSQPNRNLPRPDISSWLLGFLDMLRTQTAQLREILDGQPHDTLLSENQLGAFTLFGANRETTNRLVSRDLGIPGETAKQVSTGSSS